LKRYPWVPPAIAVVLTACSGGSERAAIVNGTEISTADVEALVYEAGEDFGDSDFIPLLDILIQWTAIAEAAETDYGLNPTQEEIASEVDRIYSEQGAGAEFEQFLEQQNISAEGLDLYAAQLLLGQRILTELDATLGEPTEAEAATLLAEDPGAWTEVCAAHILVATAEEANAVLERLGAGEEFAALAIELSTDTGSGAAGGELGCRIPSGANGYVPEFAAATMSGELGEVIGPVETQFGFHLVRVDSRTEATMAELIEGLSNVRLSDAVDEWYVGALSNADIDVAANWGTWATDPQPGIVPPPDLVP
jgi:parvulin-like peptidyl-prolyl isomerase